MSIVVEDRGLIVDATAKPESQRVCCFTSLCATKSGDLFCGYQIGPEKHSPTSTIGLSRSSDGGNTWSELSPRFEITFDGTPGSLVAGELVEAEPGRLLLFATWFDRSDPDRPVFDAETGGILRSKQLMAISSDNGESFSAWQELPTPGLTGCALTGPVVRWADETIGFAFESFKEFDDPRPAHHAAWLLVSRDGGRSFEDPWLVARHPQNTVYYWDQRLCTGSGEGEFAALFWTHDLEQQKDLRVHFRYGNLDESQEAASDDARQPVSTGIPGQIAAPQQLDDGRFIAFVVDRNRPATMKLWVSNDNGRTWPKEDSVVIYTHEERAAISQGTENVDFDQYWEDMQKWSFGHPAARVLDGKRVLLAYYAGAPDCMSIHWVRVLL